MLSTGHERKAQTGGANQVHRRKVPGTERNKGVKASSVSFSAIAAEKDLEEGLMNGDSFDLAANCTDSTSDESQFA